jgi:hypothetical protein
MFNLDWNIVSPALSCPSRAPEPLRLSLEGAQPDVVPGCANPVSFSLLPAEESLLRMDRERVSVLNLKFHSKVYGTGCDRSL